MYLLRPESLADFPRKCVTTSSFANPLSNALLQPLVHYTETAVSAVALLTFGAE